MITQWNFIRNMRGKLAKELRKMAGYQIKHDPEVKNSAEYKSAKQQYKIYKKSWKNKA